MTVYLPRLKPKTFTGTNDEWEEWRTLSPEDRMQRTADDDTVPSVSVDIARLEATGKCDTSDEQQRRRIKESLWGDVSLYELWEVRLSDMFDEDQVRNYRHNTSFDSKVFKAIRRARRDLNTDELEPVLLYVIVSFGIERIREFYAPMAADIVSLINTIDDDPYFIGYVEQTGKLRIAPSSGSTDGKMGFTYADSAAIAEDAKYFAVEDKSFLTIAFWMGALAHDDLPDDLKQYGKIIVDQFERHLNMRLKNLKALHESYSLTS